MEGETNERKEVTRCYFGCRWRKRFRNELLAGRTRVKYSSRRFLESLPEREERDAREIYQVYRGQVFTDNSEPHRVTLPRNVIDANVIRSRPRTRLNVRISTLTGLKDPRDNDSPRLICLWLCPFVCQLATEISHIGREIDRNGDYRGQLCGQFARVSALFFGNELASSFRLHRGCIQVIYVKYVILLGG